MTRRVAEGVKGPACVFLGAGDVEHVRDELLQKPALRSPAPGGARFFPFLKLGN